MARHVIIHLPHIGEDRASWAVADESGRLVEAESSGTLAEAAEAVEGRRATLVVPGDDVLLAEAVVPGASAVRAHQAVPFALEEQLADDVERLHFALGSKGRGDVWPVAALARTSMERLVAQCAEADLRPSAVVPEPLALPSAPGEARRGGERGSAETSGAPGWTVLLDGDEAVVRLHGHRGFTSDSALLPMMLEGALRDLPKGEEGAPGGASLLAYATSGTEPLDTASLPPALELDAQGTASRLELLAAGLAKASHIDLLQGEFSPKQNFDKAWKPWRWTAALAACLCLFLFAGKWLDYRRLAEREAQIDAAIAETFASALPGTRMQRPRRQMQSALEGVGAGGGDTFIARTEQIAASLAAQPATTLRSIGYRDGRFDLDLTTDALPTLDALKSAIEARGSLAMSVQSANREDEGVRGRVRIE